MLKGGDAGARRFDSTRAPKHIHLRRRRETRDAVAERDRRNRVRVTVCYSLLRMIQAAALVRARSGLERERRRTGRASAGGEAPRMSVEICKRRPHPVGCLHV